MPPLNLDHLTVLFPLEPAILPAGFQGIDRHLAGSFDEHLQRAGSTAGEGGTPDRPATSSSPPPASEPRRPEDERRFAPPTSSDTNDHDSPPADRPADKSDQPKPAGNQPDGNQPDAATDKDPGVPNTDSAASEEKDRGKRDADREEEAVAAAGQAGSGAGSGAAAELVLGGPQAGIDAAGRDGAAQEESKNLQAAALKQLQGKLSPNGKQGEGEGQPASDAGGAGDPQANPVKAKQKPPGKKSAAQQAVPDHPGDAAAASAEGENQAGDAAAKVSGADAVPLPEDPTAQAASGANPRRSGQRQAAKVPAAGRTAENAPPAQAQPADADATQPKADPGPQKVVAEVAAQLHATSVEKGVAAAKTASDGQSPADTSGLSRSSARDDPRPAPQAQETTTGASDQVDRVRFAQRVARAFETMGEHGGSIRLRLHPPDLGSLRIEMTVRNGMMRARLEAETPAARNLLLDNLPALRERLADQNIKVERFDIDLMDHSSGGSWQRPADQPQSDVHPPGGTHGRPRQEAAVESAPAPRAVSLSGEGTGFDVVV